MPFADVQAKTTINGFSAADEAAILAAMRTAYDGSATAKAMFDNWIATPGNTITIDFVSGAFQAFLPSSSKPGTLEIDLGYLTNANYIDNNGTAVQDTAVTAIVHELVHALTGRRDDGVNSNAASTDYEGATVTFSNTIYSELGLPEQNSYVAYDSTGNILTRNFQYTDGTAIDRSWSGDRSINTSAAGNSDDLLIGGPSANTLQSAGGNDFLFGGGGNDNLNGGNGTDTGVLTGKPTDYDVRLNADGTWTSRHVRGATNEGNDTFSNLEKVQFEAGQTFVLTKGGLTFQTDFAFVVDQTGSMFDDIDAVKASATTIINALFAGGSIDARIGVVGFRDNTIGEPTQIVLPFTDQDAFADRNAAALSAINSLGASGGGDFPETAFDGLLKALDGSMGDWRVGAGTKRIALFTDATAKDAFLLPTVLSFALDIGAVISARSSTALGSVGSVDTFELSFEDAAGRDPVSEGDVLPPFVPTDDPVIPPGGTATVQVFTIFVEGFTTPDPNLEEVSEATGAALLTAADPDEVVERLLEIIMSDPTNDPPLAQDDSFSVNEDTTLLGNVLEDNGNGVDSDPDGDSLTVSLVSSPAEGTLILNADGTFTYTPNADFFGTDSFIYEVSDGEFTDTATATITVDPVFDISGDDGNNFLFGTPADERIQGLGGDDAIKGRGGNDFIDGGTGDDIIKAEGGNDILIGGPGNDAIHARDGDDLLLGGDGRDHLDGGHGDNQIDGGAGNDKLEAGNGDDMLDGGPGDDRFYAGKGNDLLIGGDGNDHLKAAEGDDQIDAGAGDDTIDAGEGDDTLLGGPGDDVLKGRDGDDVLNGGAGANYLDGGRGADTFLFAAASAFDAVDRIDDFELSHGDVIDIHELLTAFDPSTDDIDDFVQISRSGSAGVLSVDADGGGDDFTAIAHIDRGKNLDVQDLIDSDSLLIA